MLAILLKIIFLYLFILVSIAYFTHAERKILAAIQRRKGPNVVGTYGLLQPLADGLKLFAKEAIFPSNANKFLFGLAPILTFFISLLPWAVIPFGLHNFLVELHLSALYLLACSALGIYGIVIAGWASNSKYAFLGAMRSTAQMISYEIPLNLFLCTIALFSGSFNLNIIVETQAEIGWFVFYFPLFFLLFLICGVAETNRHPFDLPEAEAELVSGYNVEYSAMAFALFSLGEYSNILVMSALNSILFFGGWLAPLTTFNFIPSPFWFALKIVFFVIIFVMLRAGLPRYRYDQLMEIGWQILLPISIGFFMFSYMLLWTFTGLPH